MLRRLVAVKILHESLIGDEDFLRRFRREAHAAANLSHPNIVTVHDIGQDGHRHYIVMEYVSGRTLKSLVRAHVEEFGKTIAVPLALELAIQICAGVGYAHRAGLVHCDVKPQNVLVTGDSRVKVADFGIARAMSEASVQSASHLWGTPHYFSPEQASGESATPASDVYSIGIILFEMLSGQLPFSAETLPALALKHLQEPPPSLTELNPAVPVQLERIVHKILSKEPAGRYRTAGQLERILRSYRQSTLEDTGPIPVAGLQRIAERTPQPPPVAEQPTQVFERRPAPDVTTRPRAAAAESTRRTAIERSQPAPLHVNVSGAEPEEAATDWTALTLGILAVIAMLGLIPLWYLVAHAWGVW
jgi:serine/threonine-protein kinase